jgi:plasmid stabilization system protein ParE
MKSIEFSPAAEADINEIWDYTANRWGHTKQIAISTPFEMFAMRLQKARRTENLLKF